MISISGSVSAQVDDNLLCAAKRLADEKASFIAGYSGNKLVGILTFQSVLDLINGYQTDNLKT